PGPAVAKCTSIEPGSMQRAYHRLIARLKGKVMAPAHQPVGCLAVGTGNEQFIRPDTVAFDATQRYAEHRKDRFIKTPACIDITHDKLNMIDQPSSMQFVGLHRDFPPRI